MSIELTVLEKGRRICGARNTNPIFFHYTGQDRSNIPRNASHIRIDPSIKVIDAWAFNFCKQLIEVEFLDSSSIGGSIDSSGSGGSSGQQQEVVNGSGQQEQQLEQIGPRVFRNCTSLKHIKIPCSVRVIGDYAFQGCCQLEEVDLCSDCDDEGGEGRRRLERIGDKAFFDCKSLTRIKISFNNAASDEKDSCNRNKMIGASAFGHCNQLMTVELLCNHDRDVGAEKIIRMDKNAFHFCPSLRNIYIPSQSVASSQQHGCFNFKGCHDLMKLFGSHKLIDDALKNRFDGLPIHQLCYCQSFHSTDVVLERLKRLVMKIGPSMPDRRSGMEIYNPTNITAGDDNGGQDTLGMTPLHILACSTKQNLHLYEFIVDNYPKSLVTVDKWGSLPLFYAIRSNDKKFPQEILQFLIHKQKSAYPNFSLNWNEMIESLCRAGTSLEIFQRLLTTRQTFFPDDTIDRQKAARGLMIHCLVRCDCFEDYYSVWDGDTMEVANAFQASNRNEDIQSLLSLHIHQRFSLDGTNDDDDDANWQTICEELVAPLEGWWNLDHSPSSLKIFQFLVKCNISERLNTIGVRTWRSNTQREVERLSCKDILSLPNHLDALHSQLVCYERHYRPLSEASFLLELALWKWKIDELPIAYDFEDECGLADDSALTKRQCRMNCGAHSIIPNVLLFLMRLDIVCDE